MYDLAGLYNNTDRYADAEPIYKRALAIFEKSFGPDHPDVAATLNKLAKLYYGTGRYLEAEQLFKRSLAIFEKFRGPEPPDVSEVLNNLGVLYIQQRRYAEGEQFYKRALAISEKSLGPNNPDVAKVLVNLAGAYYKTDRYADAEPLYKRALAIFEKSLGPDHSNVATALLGVAGAYFNQDRYSEAEQLYKRSLAIFEKNYGPNDQRLAIAQKEFAQLYGRQRRYAEAEQLYKRSLAIVEKVNSPNHPSVATALSDLAQLYGEQLRFAEAEQLYKRSLAIFEKSSGADEGRSGIVLQNMGSLYVGQGRYKEAEPIYKQSIVIIEKYFGPNSTEIANVLANMAGLYQSTGRHAEAELLFKRSLSIHEKVSGSNHFNVQGVLNELGVMYLQQDRYAEGVPLLTRSLAISEKLLGANNPGVVVPLQNFAGIYYERGQYKEAEPLYKRALAISEQSLGPNHPDVAAALNSLAGLYHETGRYADAERLYKRALAIFEKSLRLDHPKVLKVLNDLATLYHAQGHTAEALRIVRRTIRQEATNKTLTFSVLFQSARQKLISLDEAFGYSYDSVQRKGSSAAANAVSQLAARFAAGKGQLAEFVRKDQDLAAEAERLDKSLIAAVSEPPANRDAASEEQIRKRIDTIKPEREKLQEVFNRRFPDYVALSKPQPLSLNDTQALLADDEALVVFDFGAKSYAWVVTRNDADWTELPISAKDLGTQIKALRESLTFGVDKPFDARLAFNIYRETFGSFSAKIGSIKRISVVTNGALTSLPPQLLVTRDPAGKRLKDVEWLIRSYAITILPSVASLKILRTAFAAPSAERPIMAFADPIFSKAAHKQAQSQVGMRSLTTFYNGTKFDVSSLAEYLPQLPGTRAEVRAIGEAMHAGVGDIKLGLAATVTAVKQAKLDQYRITYFATHGLVAGDLERFSKSKAEPALALTIPDKPTDFDNGLLTASEIAQLKLNADWVVLSACNTAAEGKPGAEALSGLARAFFYAGARSLIVSHWEVNDEATARLMINTFSATVRDAKLSHGEALRQAMLAMIDGAQSDDEVHPRLWAPFVVVGEPGKLQ